MKETNTKYDVMARGEKYITKIALQKVRCKRVTHHTTLDVYIYH